jgi:hypothetical protein
MVARTALANNFTTHGVFLGGEFQCCKGRTKNLVLGGRLPVNVQVANAQLDILQSKRRVVGRNGILAWTKEEKESNYNHVGNGKGSGVRRGVRHL